MKHKILVTDNLSSQGLALLESADDVEFDVVTGLSQEALAERIPGYDGLIIRSSVKVTEDVLAAANKLSVIGRAGVGVDNVDLPSASMLGVAVMNTPGANSMATAEHSIALLLALCRHVPQAHASLKAGRWDRKKYVGVQLYQKTLGVIGLGRVGIRVAQRCRAFGMRILGYDPYLSDEAAEDLRVKRVDLPELFAQSDFITLHAALTPDTKHIINAAAIEQMKDGVYLINAARGGLVDEESLVDALKSGKMAGAALDVFIDEPLSPTSPLLELENVVITPHLAASTKEAQRDVSTQIVVQVLDALRGLEFRNAVNMPMVDASVLGTIRPFLNLAEKVGSLQTQLAEDAIRRVEIAVEGEEIESHIKLVTVAILKGMLDPILNQNVNYINAPHLAKERGIVVSQTSGLVKSDYPNMLSCRVDWGSGERCVAVTLFNSDEPRLVWIDNYRVDVRPEGTILVMQSTDRPGLIGEVGTILGRQNINIATWRTGRNEAGGMAISFVVVDSDVSGNVIKLLLEIPLVRRVKKIVL
ncbi:MAG: phosphoglycerate dehydrogenase [Anaerolineales bacterium]|nr:phosphoglycerate dehydrogenase [Anaerolineales bacterium]